MSLIVNHNMMAANVANNLSSHYGNLATSTQRLSTGLRINSAADDAAGLAIRELMRADIATLHQGARNANDAISLIQTADGALAVIDEKLIRMKELAEQAATGTYDSTQRLMIDSEFQQMASEINRIANATDFNGIHLLNGNLSGTHNGSGLNSTGSMKVHFGSGNDSAEDYYYIEIGDCTIGALFNSYTTRTKVITKKAKKQSNTNSNSTDYKVVYPSSVSVNDFAGSYDKLNMPDSGMHDVTAFTPGIWTIGLSSDGYGYSGFAFKIPKGTKGILINTLGHYELNAEGENDLQIYTTSGKHLVGTYQSDSVFSYAYSKEKQPDYSPPVDGDYSTLLGFSPKTSDETNLNTGPGYYNAASVLAFSSYNGMSFGYTGDPEQYDSNPNNGITEDYYDYEIVTISEAKEDLIVWYPGVISGYIKILTGVEDLPSPENSTLLDETELIEETITIKEQAIPSISTQELAQKALNRITDAITSKDKIRAHLGAMQNRLENTITNITTQAENLQASESRISDIDVATEMTNFVRNQILTQSAVAMLSQANSMPQMAMQIIGG